MNFEEYKSVKTWCAFGKSVHILVYTVKLLIIGDDLFGEIGELKKNDKISRRQITISQFLDIPVLEIAKLIICQIVMYDKPPNIIAAKYYRFTVLDIKVIINQKITPCYTDYVADITRYNLFFFCKGRNGNTNGNYAVIGTLSFPCTNISEWTLVM